MVSQSLTRSRISGRKFPRTYSVPVSSFHQRQTVTWLLSASRDQFPQYLSRTGNRRGASAAADGHSGPGRRAAGRAPIHLALLPTAHFARKWRVESQLVGADQCNGWLQCRDAQRHIAHYTTLLVLWPAVQYSCVTRCLSHTHDVSEDLLTPLALYATWSL